MLVNLWHRCCSQLFTTESPERFSITGLYIAVWENKGTQAELHGVQRAAGGQRLPWVFTPDLKTWSFFPWSLQQLWKPFHDETWQAFNNRHLEIDLHQHHIFRSPAFWTSFPEVPTSPRPATKITPKLYCYLSRSPLWHAISEPSFQPDDLPESQINPKLRIVFLKYNSSFPWVFIYFKVSLIILIFWLKPTAII